MQIGSHPIGPGHPVYIVAEASSNHCQDFATARMLIEAAADAGAHAVKFQSFTAEEIAVDIPILTGHDATHDAWVARMGVKTLHGLYAKGGLSRAWHKELKHIAEDVGLHFLSTPFSLDAARFLVEDIGVPALKIASGDLTFTPLLEYAAHLTDLPLLVSTGMATLAEVRGTVYGPLAPAWETDRICLLHCASSYPLDPREANLRAIAMLGGAIHGPLVVTRKSHGEPSVLTAQICPVGYSDHTVSIEAIPALAVALGAVVYEKHLRLDDAPESPDAGHSLTPEQFQRMVEVIRAVPQCLGDGEKRPQASEMHERLWTRRSLIDWKRPTDEARAGTWS